MMKIKALVGLDSKQEKERVLLGVEKIFFESSVKRTFKSPEEREAFLHKYLGWYAKNYPEYFFVAIDQNKSVHGYICGVPDTTKHPELSTLHPWFSEISEDFLEYQAHLHINCADVARGVGLGSTLLNVFENALRGKGIKGVHLVTAPDARNVGFYDKNGYKFRHDFLWNASPMLLMGKQL
ncbi:MAG: GNAT family N-acetyltransferase [Betaproteobacteria bacterium]|nr:GNAT family N-acetyltransferase [Betaproteobacteria bacterium]